MVMSSSVHPITKPQRRLCKRPQMPCMHVTRCHPCVGCGSASDSHASRSRDMSFAPTLTVALEIPCLSRAETVLIPSARWRVAGVISDVCFC